MEAKLKELFGDDMRETGTQVSQFFRNMPLLYNIGSGDWRGKYIHTGPR